jgi:S-adenosylmethionine synthetase
VVSYLVTSESVSEGHPDKVCDRISDTVLDFYLREADGWDWDPANVRVACETLATTDNVILAGEVRGPNFPHSMIENVIRAAISDIGYEQKGFHWETVNIKNMLHKQSADIARGVDGITSVCAGDQGIMSGFACDETPIFMPAPIYYSHRILENLSFGRKASTEASMLGPDAKTQITVKYEDGNPVGVSHIVLSTQHQDLGDKTSPSNIRKVVEPYIITALPSGWVTQDTVWHVNATGKFVIGGPDGDCGLTGRKIMVDTYGGAVPHGGGAFSGKDPTKVDRSAAYAARYVAKNLVAAGYAKKITIWVSYCIGESKPLSLTVDTHGTGLCPSADLEWAINRVMDFSPSGIIRHLNLLRPIYERTSSYGHFGRNPGPNGEFSWERLNLVGELKALLG